MEIETPVLLAYAIEDSTDIFRISGGGGFEHPKPPLSVRHCTTRNIFAFKYRLASPETTRLKTISVILSTSVPELFSAVLYCHQCRHVFAADAGANAR